MKILDKYVAKNFIVGYCITAFVLVGLCLMIDLFINLDEFAEHSGEGARPGQHRRLLPHPQRGVVPRSGRLHHRHRRRLFHRRMTVSNEFIAVMASGVSLKRVIVPILILSFLSTFLLVFDQQVSSPKSPTSSSGTAMNPIEGKKIANLWFMPDDKGSLICTRKYENQTMLFPAILLRNPSPTRSIGRSPT